MSPLKKKTIMTLSLILAIGLSSQISFATHTKDHKETTVTIENGELREVLDEDALKKMSDTLCVKGFKPYVGDDNKNVCQVKATAPDIAYSFVWTDAGTAAYAPTAQGPCTLNFAEHQDSVLITKEDYASNPPLSYGTEAHCCFRAAQGPTTVIETTTPVNKK